MLLRCCSVAHVRHPERPLVGRERRRALYLLREDARVRKLRREPASLQVRLGGPRVGRDGAGRGGAMRGWRGGVGRGVAGWCGTGRGGAGRGGAGWVRARQSGAGRRLPWRPTDSFFWGSVGRVLDPEPWFWILPQQGTVPGLTSRVDLVPIVCLFGGGNQGARTALGTSLLVLIRTYMTRLTLTPGQRNSNFPQRVSHKERGVIVLTPASTFRHVKN